MNDGLSNITNIHIKKSSKRSRRSSFDATGGNADYLQLKSGQEAVLCEIDGHGIVNHMWMTVKNLGEEKCYYRKIVLKIYYDDEKFPSVYAPIGDFFGMGHGMTKNFSSVPLQMSPQNGRAFNSWWPMPYRKKLKITVTSLCKNLLNLYFYVDYEIPKEIDKDALYFHAQYKQNENRIVPPITEYKNKLDYLGGQQFNLTGNDNYVILNAEGEGHYCGCNLNIFNKNTDALYDWIGEGDDMIFVDGEPFPPKIHGTGMEDYFNTAFCPKQEFNSDFQGIILAEKENWKGKSTYYRYHIQDPITFEKEIKVTIENGHNNQRNDDYSSTAYWYQREPHVPFEIPSLAERMPINEEKFNFSGEIERYEP